VLSAAINGDADLIVTGDDDLLTLGNYRGIEILSAKDALTMLEDSQN
jgi:predicted nucleic acid-binding protein